MAAYVLLLAAAVSLAVRAPGHGRAAVAVMAPMGAAPAQPAGLRGLGHGSVPSSAHHLTAGVTGGVTGGVLGSGTAGRPPALRAAAARANGRAGGLPAPARGFTRTRSGPARALSGTPASTGSRTGSRRSPSSVAASPTAAVPGASPAATASPAGHTPLIWILALVLAMPVLPPADATLPVRNWWDAFALVAGGYRGSVPASLLAAAVPALGTGGVPPPTQSPVRAGAPAAHATPRRPSAGADRRTAGSSG